MGNANVELTLDDAVAEVLGQLTGLELSYHAEHNRYHAVTRQLNRALRANALDAEWSYYSSVEDVGTAHEGDIEVALRANVRPRIIGDDAVRLVDPRTGEPRVWAYFLPRDALHKYPARRGLWVAHSKSSLRFSRPLTRGEDGLLIQVPVMREPKMFRLPPMPEDPNEPSPVVPDYIREQVIDFDYPDVVVLRAAYYVAMADPVMQPRAQTLEGEYKDLMYALAERDTRNTDSPFQNDWNLPISGSIYGELDPAHHGHPHADERFL